MSEKSRETLPVATLTIEELQQRIVNEREILREITCNSYDTKNVTDGIALEYVQEFIITKRQIGHWCLELARRQPTT